jgi:hypothetical protein
MAKPGEACLKCRKPFSSTGPGNWVCPQCNVQNSKYSGRAFRAELLTDGRVIRKKAGDT